MKDDDEYDYDDNPYKFFEAVPDTDMYFLPTDQTVPEVIIRIGDDNQYFLWTPSGMFVLTAHPITLL